MAVYAYFLIKVITDRLLYAPTLILIEKVFLILDFKNSTFCHRGARQRSKHDVKMTHAQFIEISFTPDLVSCAFQLTNSKWHCTSSHLI